MQAANSTVQHSYVHAAEHMHPGRIAPTSRGVLLSHLNNTHIESSLQVATLVQLAIFVSCCLKRNALECEVSTGATCTGEIKSQFSLCWLLETRFLLAWPGLVQHQFAIACEDLVGHPAHHDTSFSCMHVAT